ncbi:unnamed protein product [Paramecium sonneborni]|uniref:Uncharacterized protein n=1 Tax=Paramecium sonneborni TaxID=65129 RepID=A0A8S1JXP6_9CILI|nr:unnamed protein product [Paramecium sonneborni]
MDIFDQFQKFKTSLKTQIEHRPHSQQRNTVLKTKFIQSTLQTQQQQLQDCCEGELGQSTKTTVAITKIYYDTQIIARSIADVINLTDVRYFNRLQ